MSGKKTSGRAFNWDCCVVSVLHTVSYCGVYHLEFLSDPCLCDKV